MSLQLWCFWWIDGKIELMKSLMSTGQAAQLLGVSRQHVVDLCTRGTLPSVRIGTHRRIPREAVLGLTGRRILTPEQEKSLWLHVAVAGILVAEPSLVLEQARRNLDRWTGTQRRDGRAESFLRQWRQVLEGDLDEVIDVLTSRSDYACEMRPNSPFAGVLTAEQRLTVLQSYRAHRDRDHAVAG